MQALVRDLNRIYRERPALWENDFEPAGFYWLEPNDAENSVVAFARTSKDLRDIVACVLNMTPAPRPGYRVGLPRAGRWVEAINTDSTYYGGSDTGNFGGVEAEPIPWGGQPFSAQLTLPPLGRDLAGARGAGAQQAMTMTTSLQMPLTVELRVLNCPAIPVT